MVFPTFVFQSLYTAKNTTSSTTLVTRATDSYFVSWILNHLYNHRPILVQWSDWDGHWVVIIGYDTLGTDTIADDLLIFADPYDTTDHAQDGYSFFSVERFFYMWKDRNYAPKPYQLQPYIVID